MCCYYKVPKNVKTRKNVEVKHTAPYKTNLSKEEDFERLVLFRNGATESS